MKSVMKSVMKSLIKTKMRYYIVFILLTAILLVGGCDKNLTESVEKTIIPDLKNISEPTSEISTELRGLTTSESSAEVKTEVSAEDTTQETSEEINEITTDDSVNDAPFIRPYNDYIRLNEDFIGWLKIEGTSIDDPLVQGEDNAHYLEYDYTGNKNYAGAIYLDYKNRGNFYDNHMSIYAHYMEDGSMFHDLHKYKAESFLKDYPEITLSGLRETKKYEIFSVHIVSAYDYYLYLDLNDDAIKEYAAHFKRLSMHDKSVSFPEDLKLLTLVTCTYEFENARLLIHAYQK